MSCLARLRRDRRSVAALEFVAIAPFMTALLACGWDVGRAVTAYEQANTAAQAVVEAAEKASVRPDGTFSLSATTALDAMSAVFAQMPGLPNSTNVATYPGQYSVTLSSVVMSPAGCTISDPGEGCTANVAWSAALDAKKPGALDPGSAWLRSCGTLTQSSSFQGPVPSNNGRPYPLTVVPTAQVTLQSSLIIADVQYQFTPVFFRFVTGAITIWSSAEFPVPGGDIATTYVQWSPPTDTSAQICPGYM